jgi:acetyl-CoA C-acetyltransferase
MGIANRVAIIGTGLCKFGENFEKGYTDMLVEACFEAFQDAGIEPKQIQAAWLGTYLPFSWGFEGVAGTAVAEPLNLYPIPVVRVSNYCCTGMEAVRNAALSIAAGEYDVVLAVGVEKMREVPPRGSLVAQHVERGHPLYAKGRTAPGMFALLATRYFEEYGIGEEYLAKVAVKNHYHGSLNPKAHFQKEITEDMVRKAPRVAEPLGLLDCCPTTDGAAAVILTRTDLAPQFTKDYVVIQGVGTAVTGGYYTAQFDPTFSFTGFRSTREAAAIAYKQAGIQNPMREIDVVQCHDCFTITEIINYEDLGFCEKGKGWQLIRDGITRLGGELPVNTDGGLKACGHPVGASGVRMIAHICDQIRGRAGKMQVKDAHQGLAHTLGGPGSISTVFVLGRD